MAELQREFQSNTEDIDFSDGLGSEFGAEEATIVGKNQLDSFLFNEPITNIDTDKIEKVTEQPKESTPKPETEAKLPQTKEQKEEDKEAKSAEANSTLKDWLLTDEEKAEEKAKEENIEDSKENISSSEDENQFVTLSRDLYKLGVFTKDDDETEDEPIKSPEDFLEKFNLEKKKGASEIIENFLGQFGDEYKKMFNSVFVKGVDPKDYLAAYSKIESVRDLDLTNVSNQEKVFIQYYRDQGFNEERIQKRLEKSKDYGDLEDEVKDLHEIMIQKEEKNLATLEQQKEQEQLVKQKRETTYQENVGKILQGKITTGDFDGIPVSKKEAQEAFNYMTNKPYKLPNGELITEMQKDWLELDRPENHELKVKLALLLKNKVDLSKIKKRAVSEKSDSLFTSITAKKTAQTRKEGSVNAPKSFFS